MYDCQVSEPKVRQSVDICGTRLWVDQGPAYETPADPPWPPTRPVRSFDIWPSTQLNLAQPNAPQSAHPQTAIDRSTFCPHPRRF